MRRWRGCSVYFFIFSLGFLRFDASRLKKGKANEREKIRREERRGKQSVEGGQEARKNKLILSWR